MSNDAWVCLLFLSFGFFSRMGSLAAEGLIEILSDFWAWIKKKRGR